MLLNKFSIFNFQFSILFSKGFTLVEILVAISIIGIVGAVAIPGLRNFSQTQDSDHTALQLVNILKTAQSSSASSIQCPNGVASNVWTVNISKQNYSLKCQDTAGTVSNLATYTYGPTGKESSSVYQGASDICPTSAGYSTDILFTSGSIKYVCNPAGNSGNSPIKLLVQDSSGNTLKTVNLEGGGVIRIE